MRLGLRLVVAAALVACFGVAAVIGADDKPKHKIDEVMKKAMKGGLCKKCASGKASDEEKKQLVEMFESLAKNEPPKGEKASWKEKTEALVKAAKAVANGDEGAGEKLGKAATCKSCHDVHKGS